MKKQAFVRIATLAGVLAITLIASPAGAPIASAHSGDCTTSDFMELKVWTDAGFSGNSDYNCVQPSAKNAGFQWDGDPQMAVDDMAWHDIGDHNNMHDTITGISAYLYPNAGPTQGPTTYCVQFFSNEAYTGTKWFTIVFTIPSRSGYTYGHFDISNVNSINFGANDTIDSIRVRNKAYYPTCTDDPNSVYATIFI